MNSEKLIKSLLRQGEGEHLELKERVRKDEIGKTVCSFLNHEGGQILIGISESKKVLGIPDAEKWESELKSYLTSAIIPDTPIMVSREKKGAKELILIKVWSGTKQPYIFDGSIYFRRGENTVRATSQEISDLIHNRQKTDLHWERQAALGVELEDLDIQEIQKTIDRSIHESRLDDSQRNPIDFLSHFGLFQNGHFTNAAVVLFAKNPARFIPQARVRIAFLEKGKTADQFIDDKLLEGNLFKNIFSIVDFLEKYLNTSRKFDQKNWERQDNYVVPMDALREGVINALAHRDYSLPTASMSVIIYTDRIEIFNSGKSPLKASELKRSHLSMPVNPDISHMIFLRGFMEKIGRGTIKIMDACKEAGLKDPSWTITEKSVKLSFLLNIKLGGAIDGTTDGANQQREDDKIVGAIVGAIDGATASTKAKLAILLKAIIEDEGRRAPDYLSITQLGSERTLERYIMLLKEAGIIEFRGTAYHTGGYFVSEEFKSLKNK